MNHKGFLRMKYIARSKGIECEKFEVRKTVYINFGSGELTDQEGTLQLSWHLETPFTRFTMDTKEKPRIVSLFFTPFIYYLGNNLSLHFFLLLHTIPTLLTLHVLTLLTVLTLIHYLH